MAGKRQRMAEADLRAFDPVPFPEIGPGVEFNANFCRNPMCPDFGPAPNRDSYAERYRIDQDEKYLTDRRYVCRTCGMSARLLSNRSLRAAHAWCKRQSIPFAACRNGDCERHGVNVFEHAGLYRRHESDRVQCGACPERFSLGEALGVSRARRHRRHLARAYDILTDKGQGVRAAARSFGERGFDVRRFVDVSSAVARLARDYQSYCNAGLMAPDHADRLAALFARTHGRKPVAGDSPYDGAALLRTDTMRVSLKSPTTDYYHREHYLDALVTALRIVQPDERDERDSRIFLLAAHSRWVSGKRNLPPEDPAVAIEDATLPVAERRFDHLEHYGTDHNETTWLRRRRESYLGGDGLYMREDYADLAHFLVVRELTRRFERVRLCMDGDRTGYRSAAAVFAGDLRPRAAGEEGEGNGDGAVRRAEIAVVQTENPAKRRRSPRTRVPSWERETGRAAKEWRTRLAAELEKGGADLGARDRERRTARAKARLARQLMNGAWSDRGHWGWLLRRGWKNSRVAVLWLSQGPDRDGPPEGEMDAFLAKASLQSVDSAIAGLRRRAMMLSRPEDRAEPGPGYVHSSENPGFATAGLWLSWFAFNYDNFHARETGQPQAPALLGLVRPEDRRGFRIDRHLDFRLTWDHAAELTERLGHG